MFCFVFLKFSFAETTSRRGMTCSHFEGTYGGLRNGDTRKH